jgi:hypothetical protein
MLRCLLLMRLLLCAGGGAFRADGGCFHSRRLATAPRRYTPVSVTGLSSGVSMVALGSVRSGCDLLACLMLARELVCGLFEVLCICEACGCV